MFKTELIQAGHGDCIWIEYGSDSGPTHRILIDGGTSGTYKKVKERIESLSESERHFDLLVITHIDADHIAGILKLFEDTELNVTFDDIWFNGYQHLTDLETLGAKQGEALTDHLEKPGVNWNKAFAGKAARVDDSGQFVPVVLPGGMQLTLLSPTKKELADLKPTWIKEAQKAGIDPEKRLEDTEDDDTRPSGLEALGSELPDVDTLADSETVNDSSKANGSSIAFVAEYEDKRALFAGDAHGPVLLDAIEKYCPDGTPLNIDMFKTPHHGSDANVSTELLKHLNCSRYLISTNGAYFKHPDQIAVSRIIKYGGDNPQLYFNYLSKHNDVWAKQVLKDDYGYQSCYPDDTHTSIWIEL